MRKQTSSLLLRLGINRGWNFKFFSNLKFYSVSLKQCIYLFLLFKSQLVKKKFWLIVQFIFFNLKKCFVKLFFWQFTTVKKKQKKKQNLYFLKPKKFYNWINKGFLFLEKRNNLILKTKKLKKKTIFVLNQKNYLKTKTSFFLRVLKRIHFFKYTKKAIFQKFKFLFFSKITNKSLTKKFKTFLFNNLELFDFFFFKLNLNKTYIKKRLYRVFFKKFKIKALKQLKKRCLVFKKPYYTFIQKILLKLWQFRLQKIISKLLPGRIQIFIFNIANYFRKSKKRWIFEKNLLKTTVKKPRGFLKQILAKEPFLAFNLIKIFGLVFKIMGTTNVLSKYLALQLKMIRKHWPFINLIKKLLKSYWKEYSERIKGCQIVFIGKINGSSRTRKIVIKAGNLNIQQFSSNIDYSLSESFSLFGIFGIKIWLQFN